jgi:predicted nucleic acid-binding protein
VKLYVDEDGAALIRERVADETVIATALIAYVEARAAFNRHRSATRMASGEYRRLVAELDADWDRYFRIDLHPALARHAGMLAERHGLRAYDAVHLASALETGGRLGALPVFACWDRDLNSAAAREGLPLLR